MRLLPLLPIATSFFTTITSGLPLNETVDLSRSDNANLQVLVDDLNDSFYSSLSNVSNLYKSSDLDEIKAPVLAKYPEILESIALVLSKAGNLLLRGPVLKIAPLIPNFGIHLSNKFIAPIAKKLNNFDEEFKVKGLDGSQAVWLVEAENRQPEDPVIIYSHGGAYLLGFFPNFSAYAYNIYQKVGNDRLSILLLDYTLAYNGGQFPKPLEELSLVYNKLSKTCDNILLMGDSAGGHLSLGLTRHYKYPVKGVPKINQLPTGHIYLSPWTHLVPDVENPTGSYSENANLDYLTIESIYTAGTYFVDYQEKLYESPKVNYYDDYDSKWPKLVPQDSVFVAADEYELLRDDILGWCKVAKIDKGNVHIIPRSPHDIGVFTPGIDEISPLLIQFLKEIL